MADVRALPLAGERHTSSETITVQSPYNGAVLGEVPACTEQDVDRAVAAARAALPPAPSRCGSGQRCSTTRPAC